MLLKKVKLNYIDTINKRAILIVFTLSLSGLLVLAAGLASNFVFAQPIPRNDNSSISSTNQGIVSSHRFPPPPISPELSAAQISASTNKTCTLTPSLIESEGTPQQTEGPYFVEDMPNRPDIRSDPSDGSMQQGITLNLILHV